MTELQKIFEEIDSYFVTELSSKLEKDKLAEKNILARVWKSQDGCPIHQDITEIGKGGFSFYCFGEFSGRIYASLWKSSYDGMKTIFDAVNAEERFVYVNFSLPNQIRDMFIKKYGKKTK